jgi:hypothetical protein
MSGWLYTSGYTQDSDDLQYNVADVLISRG